MPIKIITLRIWWSCVTCMSLRSQKFQWHTKFICLWEKHLICSHFTSEICVETSEGSVCLAAVFREEEEEENDDKLWEL